MTDQPSQPSSHETGTDVPAQLAPDAPAAAGAGGAAAAPGVKPSAPTTPGQWAPGAEPAYGTTEPGPTTYEGGSPSRLESLFPPEKPEYAVGAAFGGGLVLALILKRLAH